MTEMV